MSRRSEYQEKTDLLIDGFVKEGITPTLFLHACCAPCSSYVLEYLSQYFEITVFYYNPNISPKSEHDFRASELERLINEMPFKNKVTLLKGKYDNDRYEEVIKGLEGEKEGGKRCIKCFKMRLTEAARLAKNGGFDYFTTTLSISPHKNAALLNEIGMQLQDSFGVLWLPSDFKKKGGFKRSTELSVQYGLYRQNYCGCKYSRSSDSQKSL